MKNNKKQFIALALAMAIFFGQFSSINISADASPGEQLIGQKVDVGYFDLWRHADGKTWQDTDYDGIRDEPGQEKTAKLYIDIPKPYYENFKEIRFEIITDFGQAEYNSAGGYAGYSYIQFLDKIVKYKPNNYYHVSGKTVNLKLEGEYLEITKQWQGKLVEGRRYYLPFIVKFYGVPIEAPPPPDNNGLPVAVFNVSTAKPLTNQQVSFTNLSYHPNSPKEKIVSYKWEVEGVGTFTSKDITPKSWPTPGNYNVKLTVWDQDGDEASLTRTINVLSAAPNEKPVASFSVSSRETTEGESISVTNNSYHPNSPAEKITVYEWKIQQYDELTGWYVDYKYTRDIGSVTWYRSGTYRITLTVVDQDGDSDSDSIKISVDEAIPIAEITAPDEMIVNREVTIHGKRSYAPVGDIVPEKNRWEIYRPNGTLAWSGQQEYPKNDPPPNNFFNISGDWKVRLQVEDDSGTKSEWAEHIIKVLPDNKPLVDFTLPEKAIRNVVNNYEIQAQSTSYPAIPDRFFGEEIFKHDWVLKYDSDNNGTHDITINPNTTNSYAYLSTTSINDKSPKIKAYVTGNFRLELQTQERYFSWGTWKAGLYSDKVIKDFVVENLAPVGTFNTLPIRNTEITFVIDGVADTVAKRNEIQNNIANFQQKLLNSNIKPTINIKTENNVVPWQTYGHDPMQTFHSNFDVLEPYNLYNTNSINRFGWNTVLNKSKDFGNIVYKTQTVWMDGHIQKNVRDKENWPDRYNQHIYKTERTFNISKDINDRYMYTFINTPPALSNDGRKLYFINQVGYMQAVDTETDAKLWEKRVMIGSDLNTDYEHRVFLDNKDNVYVVGNYSVDSGRTTLIKINPFNGDEIWGIKKSTPGYEMVGSWLYMPIVDDKNIYCINEQGYFWVVNKDTGKLVWYLEGNFDHFKVDESYVYLRGDEGLRVFDKNTGQYIKNLSNAGQYFIVQDDYLFLVSSTRVTKMNKHTGSIIWRQNLQSMRVQHPVTDNKNIYVIGYTGSTYNSQYLHIYIINKETGEIIKQFNDEYVGDRVENEQYSGPVITSTGSLLTYARELGNIDIGQQLALLSNLEKYNTWKSNNQYRYFVSISESAFGDMSNAENVAQNLSSNLASLVVIGNNTTIQNQTKELFSFIDGTYIPNNTDMAVNLDKLADYIIANINSKSKSLANVVLVGEEVKYQTNYFDLENDPKVDDYWYFQHDYTKIGSYTLSNNQGRDTTKHNKQVETPFNIFEKPGNYPTKYVVKDQVPNRIYATHKQAGDKWSETPPSNIIVHRRPIAGFTTNKTTYTMGETIVYNNTGYDPDLQYTDPTGHKGISKTRWRYKNVNDTTWIYADYAPEKLNKPGKWFIGQQVEDVHGALSEWFTLTIDVQNRKPIAKFLAKPKTVGLGQNTQLLDYSYDPDGNEIVEWEWNIEGSFTNEYSPVVSFSITGVKSITLRVKDQFGLWSDPYTDFVTVVNNPIVPPVARFNPSPNPVTINTVFSYNDTSYHPQGYKITKKTWYVKEPEAGYEKIYLNTQPPNSYSVPGDYTISLEVEDENGLLSERVTRILKVIDPLEVIGDSDKEVYHAGEAMILSAYTEGRAFKVEAEMWWSNGNDFVNETITQLVPEKTIGSNPPDINNWITRHDVLRNDYDRVVIIPKDMPDGIYQVKFMAFRRLDDGTIETATDTINVKVEGSQYNRIRTRIIS